MNNSSDNNQRKKRIVIGSGSAQRRSDTPVNTNGPVGRKDAYEGRRTQFQSKPTGSFQQNTQQSTQQNNTTPFTTGTQGGGGKSTGGIKLGRILLIVGLIIVGIIVLRCTLCSGGCSLGSVTDMLGGEELLSNYTDSQSEDTSTDLW